MSGEKAARRRHSSVRDAFDKRPLQPRQRVMSATFDKPPMRIAPPKFGSRRRMFLIAANPKRQESTARTAQLATNDAAGRLGTSGVREPEGAGQAEGIPRLVT
ncbi:MAG: hypothetical protein E5Y88_01510 [Mesorhizobium sp.]|uniref:hypothetical protein n=1 Tax=unclassified Mesorhizobium TaxID=325217 RepID=UPI000FD238A8|nr:MULTISPECIES: hypothetical protein [unclassified Mesorhizobium]RVB77935.1 hypothetical protein EN885_11470 [Mesorhizobium sp. M6A.T.Cr.TU.014.01.1.1]RWQ07913.1 MAG: hypothetical protein EOR90_10775 [Mesorhizobium sp.]RWQ08966.1 MAG: hypothetical protein EOR91_09915 [Mesorhizobium sp.]RWQ41340.1 MAG: hypothetical protein EOS20_01375 [Mesorhizobium sp.]TIL27731.1 MAG: hypothetical protein E5Y88_01510 [Mesorhizobium sp.]